jgi:hypothetical protein
VKVGTKLGNEAAVPGAKGIGAQIRNIRSLQASFRDEVLTKASAMMTLARMNQEIHLSGKILSDSKDGGKPVDGNKYENDLMLSQIKTKLLPLLLKEEVSEMNFWRTVNSAKVESAMNDIVAKIQQHRGTALSDILGTIKEAVSPNTKRLEKQRWLLPCTKQHDKNLDANM